MSDEIIWLHEDALRLSHPVFAASPPNCGVFFIWDDAYLQEANYSLKRLLFLYETLCKLPLVILRGNTLETLRSHAATQIYVPSSPNPWIKSVCEQLSANKNVKQINDEPFARIKTTIDFKRFYPYWNEAKKSAFVHDGDDNT